GVSDRSDRLTGTVNDNRCAMDLTHSNEALRLDSNRSRDVIPSIDRRPVRRRPERPGPRREGVRSDGIERMAYQSDPHACFYPAEIDISLWDHFLWQTSWGWDSTPPTSTGSPRPFHDTAIAL